MERNRAMKRLKINPTDRSDLFERLPDDLVILILCKLTSTALCPSDFFSVLITCKRLKRLAYHPLVLNRAGSKTLAVRARTWCELANRFLRLCVSVGNMEACYILGMIRFYCLQNRSSGLSLMAKAGMKSHKQALYSLAVIHFNGSGEAKDLRAGVAFCARAASLGHVDALRELGHCLQDGYGVPRNVSIGRRFILQANARELARSLGASSAFLLEKLLPNGSSEKLLDSHRYEELMLLRELYGCHVADREPHPVNKFLMEWFGSKELQPRLKMCSNTVCGRPETRANEYRKCSVCGLANYCSRGCQAQDWKMRHKVECAPLDQWIFNHAMDGEDLAGDVEGDDPVAEVEELVGGD